MNTDDLYKKYLRERNERNVATNYRYCYRLLCDGVVIDTVNQKEAVSLFEYFKDNLTRAFGDSGYVFDGKMERDAWIQHHETRLGVKLSANLEIVPPGDEFPLCKNSEALLLRGC